MKHFSLLIVGCFAIVPVIGFSAEEEAAPLWTAKAELGIVNTTGNTETSSTSTKFNAIYDPEDWRHELRYEYLKADAVDPDGNTQDTAERSYVRYKADYKFSESGYFYGLTDYTDDRFSGYDFVINASFGAGTTFFKSKQSELSVEIGVGQRRFRFDINAVSPQPTVDFETQSETVSRAAGNYRVKVSETSEFRQELVAEFANEFDLIRSSSALDVKVNSALALSLGYEVVYISNPPGEGPDELQDTDTRTTVNLVYSF